MQGHLVPWHVIENGKVVGVVYAESEERARDIAKTTHPQVDMTTATIQRREQSARTK